ncbi:hypothetical protein T4D_1692 [Trichinella pseudospiralis]|uniref:Uncharacterized protein n=1 Tax=Trichinella pseudospiralis TaxID=6337 RepID=A0A0V1F7A5_TRIPS|nr:hypothetical protein T4D_1692 [Trichinella pseudospiralis]
MNSSRVEDGMQKIRPTAATAAVEFDIRTLIIELCQTAGGSREILIACPGGVEIETQEFNECIAFRVAQPKPQADQHRMYIIYYIASFRCHCTPVVVKHSLSSTACSSVNFRLEI